MRNLVLYDISRTAVLGGLTAASDVLLANDHVYMVIDNVVYEYDVNSYNRNPVSEEHKCWTRLHLMLNDQRIWYGTGKSIVFYCTTSKTVDVIETRMEFSAAEWSPSQEILIVVSVDDEVLSYSVDQVEKHLNCLGACHLSDAISTTSETVGWGSGDTQFRGTEGRASTSGITEVTTRHVTDKMPRIVWREDQEYFLVNYWIEGKRMFKVFRLPCTPVYVSEDTPGLQSPISWRCTGNMIGCPVYTDKWQITFFEKNGLPRHSFDLHDQIEVVDLQWDRSGEILAVHQKFENLSHISLYKRSNYHWYLKQRLDFNYDNPLTSFKWGIRSDSVFELYVSTAKEVLIYRFINKVNRCLKSDSHGTCTVVDGNKILVYNFSDALVSPPDAGEVVELKNPASHVVYHPSNYEVLIIDSKNVCYIFDFEGKAFALKRVCDLEVPLEFKQYPFNLHHYCWRDDQRLFAVGMSSGTDKFDILFEYNSNLELLVKDVTQSNINYIEFINETDSFLKLCGGREIYLTDATYTSKFSSSIILSLNAVLVLNRMFLISLNLTNELYIDNVCVADNVTSCLIYYNYLYITTQDRLYCIRLTIIDLEDVLTSAALRNCYSREIEKGGILIAGVPGHNGILLQMPRGNIEVNSCRIVTIDKLEALLQRGSWNEGSELIRLERLNTNLLVDLNPHRFFRELRQFLNVDSCNSIVNFMLELVDENVLHTTYKHCLYISACLVENKKKSVCKAIISHVSDLDILRFVKVIMIASINVDGVDSAVNYLKQVHSNNPEQNKSVVLKGLECLDLYFSYEIICKSALATYDTDFALIIYENSSIDPKIYQPIFEEFNACKTENQKYFKINDHLQLHSDALKYLARDLTERFLSEGGTYEVTDTNVLIDYASRHKLLSELYEMTITTTIFFDEISLAYGTYLREQSWHKEAGIVFACAKFYKEALEQYRLCNQWQEAMFVLERIETDEIQKLMYITEVAQGLEKSNNYKDASFLYEVYLNDCELAVTVLIKGKLFTDAMRVAQKFRRADLIETIIKPPFLKFVDSTFLKMEICRTNFENFKRRLGVVRQKKIELFIASEENPEESEDATNQPSSSVSVLSRTTTTRSTRSRTTSTSMRSRRKEELKKRTTREGGYYEDIALLRTLHQLVTEMFDLGPEVSVICPLLVLFKFMKVAKNLQNLLETMQSDMIESFPEIWPDNLNSFAAAITPELLALRENLEFLELVYRYPPEVPNKPWKVNLK